MTARLTKTEKLVNALTRGEELTSEQIERRFGLLNPTATIHRLRSEKSLPVYTNPRGRWAAVKTFKLGKPAQTGVYF